ncbi:hypothetical protein JR316_0006151 [Psilocybe cubensis]|uniref:Uncharacterized protein n=2 Tax=Psilocybe cubensis TaxID=181762 RepID=A0A8H7Y0K3_PSICU|nr:hypothetical protein JR316_0006151 [Psilocybe cubensis]KAH9481624.1 hypothetical protein JR316_0006151 [Psilocybe cubensis]
MLENTNEAPPTIVGIPLAFIADTPEKPAPQPAWVDTDSSSKESEVECSHSECELESDECWCQYEPKIVKIKKTAEERAKERAAAAEREAKWQNFITQRAQQKMAARAVEASTIICTQINSDIGHNKPNTQLNEINNEGSGSCEVVDEPAAKVTAQAQ